MKSTHKLSELVETEVIASEVDTIEDIATKLGIRLSESESTKIVESAKKFVDVFHNDLSDFKETIDDATYHDIDYLSEFNASKEVMLSSSDIKSKVLVTTGALDRQMETIGKNEYRRNLFDLILQKSKEDKEREVLVGFIDYVKHKQDEFATFSQEITVNVDNLKREKSTVEHNAKSLSKKAIMLSVTSSFFKSVLPKIETDHDYQLKLSSIDRRLRTMYEILYMTQKSVIDIDNQIGMFLELQNVIDEYKISAMRILSMEVKNRIVLQDIKTMYESLNSVRDNINRLIQENTKFSENLVKEIHTLSKESILDRDVVDGSMESATRIQETHDQRQNDIHRQIQQDNREYLEKISKTVLSNERRAERRNAKVMLEV